MEIQLINKELLGHLHKQTAESARSRQNFDLRTTTKDGSQRMLNALEAGTHVPIHRHLKTSESAADETCFVETARFSVCPREGLYGIQVPLGVWHSVVVHEPSAILEAKDGTYGK